MTEIANPDGSKLGGFDVAFVEKWENIKLPTLIFLFMLSQAVKK